MLQAERGSVNINNVLVVPSDSTDVGPRLQAGEARREQQRAQVRDLVIDLREWLQSQGGRASCTAAETEARRLGNTPNGESQGCNYEATLWTVPGNSPGSRS